MVKQAIMLAGLLCLVLILAACGSNVQTSSGKAYLSHFESETVAEKEAFEDTGSPIASKIEPDLTFPARIGLARLENGKLSSIPQIEAEAWLDMAQELGPGWGEFVPISPLVVSLGSPDSDFGPDCGQQPLLERSSCERSAVARTIANIRLSAARQHADAVLVYEVFAKSAQRPNPLADTKLAQIGFFIASIENIEADGHSQGLLVDVQNGQNYGFATAVAEDAAFTFSTSANSGRAAHSVEQKAKTAAAIEFAEEARDMFRSLRLRLSERRMANVEMDPRLRPITSY